MMTNFNKDNLKIKEQFEDLQVSHITLKSETDNVNLMLAQAIDYIGVHE